MRCGSSSQARRRRFSLAAPDIGAAFRRADCRHRDRARGAMKSRTRVWQHISTVRPGAARGGPRGRGALSDEEVRQPENGIWVCATHGRAIDANRGESYPAPLLLSFKQLREARAALAQRNAVLPLSWVLRVSLDRAPYFAPRQSVSLGKVNLLTGGNGVGKSAICDWIAGLGGLQYLWRWQGRHGTPSPIELTLEYFDPEPHNASLVLGKGDSVEHRLDGESYPLNPIPFHIVFPCREDRVPLSEVDDVEFLARVLRLPSATIRNLTKCLGEREGAPVANARVSVEEADGDTYERVRCDVEGTHPGLSLNALSSGEKSLVVLEYSIEACRVLSRSRPTLLILDSWAAKLDHWALEHYVGSLSSAEPSFQTIVAIPSGSEPLLEKFRWLGWSVMRLVPSEAGTVIDQGAS